MSLLISVIIPSYNQGQFISKTIESILSQSYKNVEILVIDGGSSDNTVDILKGYENRIYWVSEKDNGQTDAINKGMAMAKGDILTYLNSDDFYLDGALEKVAEVFNSIKNTFWITGDYLLVDKQGNRINSPIVGYKKLFRKILSFKLLTVLNPIIQPSTFLSRGMVEQVGTFNEKLIYTMDYEYWLRAIKIHNPVVLDAKLSAFRVHKNSKGGSQFKQQFNEELQIARKYQSNKGLLFLHYLHNQLIGIVYSIIK